MSYKYICPECENGNHIQCEIGLSKSQSKSCQCGCLANDTIIPDPKLIKDLLEIEVINKSIIHE